MRVLSLDFRYTYEPADLATFSSTTSCLDYDAVIWDPTLAIDGYRTRSRYRGLPSLDENSSVTALHDIARRRREFAAILELGRVLVVLVSPPQRFYYDTGRREHSGTGRNRQTTRFVQEADFWHALPREVQLTAASGTHLDCSTGSGLRGLWSRFKDSFAYEAYMSQAVGQPGWHIAGTKNVAGSVERTREGGLLVLLPAVWFEEVDITDDDVEDATPDAAPFFADLLTTLEAMRNPDAVEVLPEWANEYQLPDEPAKRAALVTRTTELQTAEAGVSEAADELRRAQRSKVLFTGTGRPLELAVRQVLEHLGGQITEPPPGRDDWIVTFPEGEAVVEVKGVQGSGAERDAAQLEKWVAQRIADTQNVPKGILVVNGWRLLPLSERVQPVFPDQMLAYSVARKHSLVTGVQLLGMLLAADSDAEKGKCREILLNTAGLVAGYDDWRTFLEHEVASTGIDEQQPGT
jgi:hypothetical protein